MLSCTTTLTFHGSRRTFFSEMFYHRLSRIKALRQNGFLAKKYVPPSLYFTMEKFITQNFILYLH